MILQFLLQKARLNNVGGEHTKTFYHEILELRKSALPLKEKFTQVFIICVDAFSNPNLNDLKVSLAYLVEQTAQLNPEITCIFNIIQTATKITNVEDLLPKVSILDKKEHKMLFIETVDKHITEKYIQEQFKIQLQKLITDAFL